MDTAALRDRIESYLTRETDVDELSGYYAIKGTLLTEGFPGEKPIERLEVGEVLDDGYSPLVKLKLNGKPNIDKGTGSYLDGAFSGNSYRLEREEFDEIRKLVENDYGL